MRQPNLPAQHIQLFPLSWTGPLSTAIFIYDIYGWPHSDLHLWNKLGYLAARTTRMNSTIDSCDPCQIWESDEWKGVRAPLWQASHNNQIYPLSIFSSFHFPELAHCLLQYLMTIFMDGLIAAHTFGTSSAKGQLISKCLFDVFNFSQKNER